MKTKECKWQFVEPHNHRVNAAERAIQTWKNHMISGLCCTDSDWPLQLWDNVTEQASITLNLCRTSRKDPTKSAWHSFHSERYDWNKHPMAPPGTRAVVYEAVGNRLSWGPRGIDAWYCGPCFDHYRNLLFFIPETGAYRKSASYDLYPQHCVLPELNQQQHAEVVQEELVESIQLLKKKPRRDIIKKLRAAMDAVEEGRPIAATEGVVTPPTRRTLPHVVPTSTNPTNSRILSEKPRTHLRITRDNTSGTTPAIVAPDPAKRR